MAMEKPNSRFHKNNNDSRAIMAIVMIMLLFSTSTVIMPLNNTIYASTNTIEDFDQGIENATDELPEQDSSSLDDSTGLGTGSNNNNNDDESSSDDRTGSSTTDGNEGGDNTAGNDDTSQTDATQSEEQQSNSLSSIDPNVALVNPNAYTYQTNPAENSIIISGVAPASQKINTIVKNSFGQGVADIPIEVQVKDPMDKASTFNGKTDTNGRNQIEVPVDKEGTWTAEVSINSPPEAGGPFKDTISWEAVNLLNTTPPPQQTSTLEYDSKIAYPTVDIINDPRQQILTTVKNSSGVGVKDVELTIKLTNPDSQSATFSRITDANGVDEFVTPVEKNGTWNAVVSVKDMEGKESFKKEHSWTAISPQNPPLPPPPSAEDENSSSVPANTIDNFDEVENTTQQQFTPYNDTLGSESPSMNMTLPNYQVHNLTFLCGYNSTVSCAPAGNLQGIVKVHFNYLVAKNDHDRFGFSSVKCCNGEWFLSAYIQGQRVPLLIDRSVDDSAGDVYNLDKEIVVNVSKEQPLSIFTLGLESDSSFIRDNFFDIQGIPILPYPGAAFCALGGDYTDQVADIFELSSDKWYDRIKAFQSKHPNPSSAGCGDKLGFINVLHPGPGWGAGKHQLKSSTGDFILEYTITVLLSPFDQGIAQPQSKPFATGEGIAQPQSSNN